MEKGAPASSNYGRSCANCSKAKSRCVPRSESDGGCQRCHRLRKHCVPAKSIRYRPESPPTPENHPSGTSSQLEDRLEKLVSLLQEQQDACRSRSRSEEAATTTPSVGGSVNGVQTTNVLSGSTTANVQSHASPALASSDNSRPSCAPHGSLYDNGQGVLEQPAGTVLPCAGEPSPIQANEFFDIFKTKMLRYFPVVHFPETMTAEKLRGERPFLWLCIMCVACTCTSQQQQLGDSIRKIIAREVVYHNLRNMDLLLGILVYIPWSYYQVNYMRHMTSMYQLAIALVYDIGLNKPKPRPRGRISFRPVMDSKYTCSRAVQPPRGIETMEDRRAVLGCFLASSLGEIIWRRAEALRWTSTMDESLSALDERPECIGDSILAVHVKVQLIISQVNRSNCTWPFGNSVYDEAQDQSSCHLDRLLAQLQKIEEDLSPELAKEDTVMSCIRCARIVINEASLATQSAPLFMLNLSRVERFGACLEAIKSWYDAYLTVEPSSYNGFTYFYTCNIGYAILTIARFTTTKDSAWDPFMVRRVVDVVEVCSTVAQRYEIAAKVCNMNCSHESDFFTEYAAAMRRMERHWKAEVERLEQGNGEALQADDPLREFLLSPDMFFDWDPTSFVMDTS